MRAGVERMIGRAANAISRAGRTMSLAIAGMQLATLPALAQSLPPTGQPLPWQHLDMGVTQEYLAAELQRSESGKFTPMCFAGMMPG